MAAWHQRRGSPEKVFGHVAPRLDRCHCSGRRPLEAISVTRRQVTIACATAPLTRSRRVRLVAVLRAALLVTTVFTEFITRTHLAGHTASVPRHGFTGPVTAGIATTPPLLNANSHQISTVNINAPVTPLCSLRDVNVAAPLNDAHNVDGHVTARGAHVNVTLSSALLTSAITPRTGAQFAVHVTSQPARRVFPDFARTWRYRADRAITHPFEIDRDVEPQRRVRRWAPGGNRTDHPAQTAPDHSSRADHSSARSAPSVDSNDCCGS